MADVTAPQFQQDVNNTAEWANGDESTTVTMRLGQEARSPAKVIADIEANFEATQAGELTAQAVDAANRAETSANVAMTAGWVYASVADGEASRVEGEYFWIVSADDSEVLELWEMGVSNATDTGKRTVSTSKVLKNEHDINRLKSTKSDLSYSNLFDKTTLEQGYIRSSDGEIVFDADSYTSGLIPVDSDTTYYLQGRTLVGTNAVIFYDVGLNKLPPAGADYESYPLNGSIAAPSNASYIRFTVIFNSSGSAEIVKLAEGAAQTDYVPYKKLVDLNQSRALPEDSPIFNQHKNLFDKKTMVTYDSLVNNSDGSIVAASGWCYAQIPLSENSNPYLSINKGLSDVSSNDDIVHFFNSSNARIGTSSTIESILVPADAAYFRINVSSSVANNVNAINTFSVTRTENIKNYTSFKVDFQVEQKYIPEKDLSGALVTWVGDSIVKGDGGYDSWVKRASSELGAATINKGDNGATIANIYPTVSCMSGALLTYQYDTRTDLTIFSGGTNDFANDLQLGDETDMIAFNDTTVKGSLNKAIQWVKDNNPSSQILVTTPLERSTDATNGIGLKLKDYRDAIIEVCEHQNIECIDNMFNNLISQPTAYKYLYDGLHPNSEGYAASFDAMKSKLISALY